MLSLKLLVSLFFNSYALPLAPDRLRVEYMTNPQGVDVNYPIRFSWALMHTDRAQAQLAYHIIVCKQQVNSSSGVVVWDSGVVLSNISQNVPYGGLPLLPDSSYVWNVSYTDSNKQISPFSSLANFTTGLFSLNDWKGAQWIGSGDIGNFRTTFNVKNPVFRATAYIVGLGYFKFFANGMKASTHELGEFMTFNKRVYYHTIDITDNVNNNFFKGVSIQGLGVSLGNGWYSQPGIHAGLPSLLVRVSIQYVNGINIDVISDLSWTYNKGAVVSSDIFQGEVYDSRLETTGWSQGNFQPSQPWSPVKIMPPPGPAVQVTSHAIHPVIHITQTYSPCDIYESAPNVWVFDFCQNMAGFATLKVPEGLDIVVGTNISMWHAEGVYGPPPAPINHFYGNANELNTYLTRGDGQAIEYTPLFTYAGFRYIQLTGYPGSPSVATLTAHFIHTDYELTGDISFSDSDLNAVQRITRAAAMSNFMGIPTDCPQRERHGWLGDAQLSAETNLHNFDMSASYTSFIQQIADSQEESTGAVQDCVPWYGWGYQPADPAWGGAFALLADWVGTYYHDDQIFRVHYNSIQAHTEQLISTAQFNKQQGLLAYGGWSDWCPPQGCAACWANPQNASVNSVLVSSFYYITELRVMARYATILNKTDDAKRYSDLSDAAGKAFNAQFYDSAAKTYREPNRGCGEYLGPQTTISLADNLGLIPAADYEQVIDNLVSDVAAHDWHLNVGIVGVKYLLPTLSRAGRGDVALMIAQARTPPSYIYMVEQGATTLWETWTGSRYAPDASWNHIMFGSQSDWYFKFLAGLQMQDNTRGWQNLRLQPQVWNNVRGESICQNLSSVSASIVTPRGVVAAEWSCSSNDGLCGNVRENNALHLGCDAGTISKIDFASFGTPIAVGGWCSEFQLSNCSSPNSIATVEKLCLGQTSCDITASNDVFGGDPCVNTPKSLAVVASGCKNVRVFAYAVTIPVGSQADVYLPMMGIPAASVQITEGGTLVWNAGAFIPGVSGIQNIVVSNTDLVVSVGSGIYKFGVLNPAGERP